MIGVFGANRKAIQAALYDLSIIERIEDNEYCISESKDSATLQDVTISNIPISSSDYGENAFWVLNLEHAQNLFSAPTGFKTAEKILLFFTCNRLYVLIVEMKSTLQPFDHDSGVNAIYKKVKDSIGRFLTLLPYFVFDQRYKDLDLRFVALIAYNEDNLKPFLENKSIKHIFSSQEQDLVNTFLKNRPTLFIQPEPGKTQEVTFLFVQNPNKNTSPESLEIDLQDLFSDEAGADFDFPSAEYNEFQCPHQ